METKEDKSFGVVSVFKDGDNLFFCLVKHAEGHWGFPKGHQDEGESDQETAIRELKEETGTDVVDFSNKQIFIEKYSFEKDGFQYNKSVKYFLGIIPEMVAITPDSFKKEIPDLKWVSYEEAKKLITFPEGKRVLEQAFNYLRVNKA